MKTLKKNNISQESAINSPVPVNKDCELPPFFNEDYFGHVVVQTIEELNDIPCKLRQDGMLATVVQDSYAEWQLQSSRIGFSKCDNRSWVKINSGDTFYDGSNLFIFPTQAEADIYKSTPAVKEGQVIYIIETNTYFKYDGQDAYVDPFPNKLTVPTEDGVEGPDYKVPTYLADGAPYWRSTKDFGKVKSVNGKIGEVVLKTSDLENDSDYTTNATLTAHTSNKANPHNVTKEQIGLWNVDNTSDLNKPISTATQLALDSKIPTTDVKSEIIYEDLKPVNSKAVEKYSIKKVNTVAELRNIEGEYNGQIISLLGYYKAGDKEPLNYVWKDVQDEEDGGSVINTGNGSWIIASDVVTIKDFGAKGDNIQDDTSFIQKAFDFINSEKKKEFGGFREIKIPKGVFKITKALKFPTETSLIGEGITNSVIKTLNNNHNAIEVKEDTLVEANELKQGERTFLSSFSVRGILYGVNPFGAFDQERIRVNSSNSGIVVDSVLRVTLNNISTKGFESRGMYFTNTYYNSVVNSESGNNKVGLEVSNISTSLHCINSEFRLNSQGIRITNTSYANRFVSCLVEANIANYTDKISFLNSSANYSGVGVVIENSFMNTFTDSYVEAHVLQIYLLNSYRNKFSNSFFAAGSHGESFPMNTLDGHSGLLLNSDNNSFIDNEYTTNYPNVKCRFWFVNSKNALFEFTNNDNFNEFITESSETLNSLPVADENPKAFYKGGNKSYINGVRGAYSASVTLGDEANSPKISGSLAMINGELTYYDGSNHLTVDYKNSPLVKRRGTTAERPNANDVVSGYEYYDTDIKKPIYSDNVANVWLNSMGEIV